MGEIHTSAMSASLCSAVTYSTGLGEHRERVRERRYILYHFLFCQAMSFWPCSWYASTLLSILLPGAFICESVSLSVCLSCWSAFYLSVCVLLLTLPVSPSTFLSLFAYTRFAAGNIRCTLQDEEGIFASFHSRHHARCRLSLYTHFWPHGQEGVFSVAFGLHFQKAFPSSCLSSLHVWRKLRLLFSNQKC